MLLNIPQISTDTKAKMRQKIENNENNSSIESRMTNKSSKEQEQSKIDEELAYGISESGNRIQKSVQDIGGLCSSPEKQSKLAPDRYLRR